MSNKEILSAAMSPPPQRREKIAESITASIKKPSKRHIEALWAIEAESRIDALLAGRVKTAPATKVLASRGANAR